MVLSRSPWGPGPEGFACGPCIGSRRSYPNPRPATASSASGSSHGCFHRQVMMIKQPPCVVHKRNPGWWFIYGLYMVYIWFIYIYSNIYIYIYYIIYIILYIYLLYIYIIIYIYILVGGFNQPLWKMMEWTSDGIMKFPTEWKVIKHVPNHQPEPEFLCDSTDF